MVAPMRILLSSLIFLSLSVAHASEWQTENYATSDNHPEVYPITAMSPPKSWEPDLSNGLDAALPFPWPDKYIEKFKQPFNPWAFFRNASALCSHYEISKSGETLKIIQALYDRLLEYSAERDGQRFLLYNFKKGYRGIAVDVPWTSAYASGAALIGLTFMSECADMPEALTTAKEVLAGLASPIDPSKNRPDLWVSFVDDRGFLWFEEKPLDQVEQPRILNGHIRALTGLYIYWAHTKDEEALPLLRAGIKTIEEYAPSYRIPGKVNAYDMIQPPVDDYGPERTIAQQDILFKMTGEPVFAIYRDVFEMDMRDEIEAAKAVAVTE